MRISESRQRSLAGMDADTRRRVEAAALGLFSSQELHKVKLIDIATEARISLQTVYKYYGSKETLLLSCMDVWLGDLAQRMIDHLQAIENHKDRLRKVFWLLLDYFQTNPQVARIIMSSVYLDTWRDDDTFRQPELMTLFLKVLRDGRNQGVLSQEVDETELLDIFLGVATRRVSMWLVRGQQTSLTANSATVFEMLWRAMAAPAESDRTAASRGRGTPA